MAKYMIADHVVEICRTAAMENDPLAPYLYTGEREAEQVFGVEADTLQKECDEWLSVYRSEIEDDLLSKQFCVWLAGQDGMYLHSSAVEYKGNAYAFTAPPGTGKSTHAHLWKQTFGADKVKILNDDKPFLLRREGVFYVCGSPWCGKEHMTLQCMTPLRGLCILKQGEKNEMHRVDAKDAVVALLSQTIWPDDRSATDQLMNFIDGLVRAVPVWQLTCNISEDAVRLSYQTMRPETEDSK